jgi:hypothetical protein
MVSREWHAFSWKIPRGFAALPSTASTNQHHTTYTNARFKNVEALNSSDQKLR